MKRCDHTPLCKFIYSVNKNDEVKNWSQEIQSITPYINFKHIKGKNVLANSLSGLKCLGLYKDNDPEKPGYDYGKFILILTKIQYVMLTSVKI